MCKVEDVVHAVIAKKPMHRRFLKSGIEGLTVEELRDCKAYIEFLRHEGMTSNEIADAYLTIVNDTWREEMVFRETGAYRYSFFSEARDAVYDNETYMHRYMVGLALSSFWWHNHTEMRRFFKQQLPRLAVNGGLYREIGPGHGMYFLESLRQAHFSSYEGIDISPVSVAMTNRIIKSGFFGEFPCANVFQSDFLSGEALTPSDALVMGEVLEHVEVPDLFLGRAYDTMASQSRLFLTTCINAPAIDHLYNPGSINNLEDLFVSNRFVVEERCVVPRHGASLEQCVEERLAINVAYLLRRSD